MRKYIDIKMFAKSISNLTKHTMPLIKEKRENGMITEKGISFKEMYDVSELRKKYDGYNDLDCFVINNRMKLNILVYKDYILFTFIDYDKEYIFKICIINYANVTIKNKYEITFLYSETSVADCKSLGGRCEKCNHKKKDIQKKYIDSKIKKAIKSFFIEFFHDNNN